MEREIRWEDEEATKKKQEEEHMEAEVVVMKKEEDEHMKEADEVVMKKEDEHMEEEEEDKDAMKKGCDIRWKEEPKHFLFPDLRKVDVAVEKVCVCSSDKVLIPDSSVESKSTQV